jgi:hypothetical protein
MLDVTANTNRQKRDLFLMVVKDPCGSVYIGNITFIPSGKRWVYDMIYKKLLHYFAWETDYIPEQIGSYR